jgi:hypothetical protein
VREIRSQWKEDKGLIILHYFFIPSNNTLDSVLRKAERRTYLYDTRPPGMRIGMARAKNLLPADQNVLYSSIVCRETVSGILRFGRLATYRYCTVAALSYW